MDSPEVVSSRSHLIFSCGAYQRRTCEETEKVGNSDLYNAQWLSNIIMKFIPQCKIGDKLVLTWAAGTTRKKRWYSGFKMLSVLNVSVTYCWKWMNVIRLQKILNIILNGTNSNQLVRHSITYLVKKCWEWEIRVKIKYKASPIIWFVNQYHVVVPNYQLQTKIFEK